MDAADFANAISFRLYGPHSRCRGYGRLSHWTHRLTGRSLEVLNTRLPEDTRAMRRRIEPLLDMPRMSTFAIAALINKAVAQMPPASIFLNVGVWHGFTLLSGMAGNADRRSVGVDNFSEFEGPASDFHRRFDAARGPNDAFYELDYREYFASTHGGAPIGFYIYDGVHTYEDQLLGLELADPFLVPGALILVDDTNKEPARRATLDFVAARADRYAVVADRTTHRPPGDPGHPTLWNGLMLVRRV